MEGKQENSLRRLRLIKDQLLSKKEVATYKTNKNPLNKWKKKCNFDKDLLEDVYFPYHRDLRDYIYKIMINSPDFR